MAKVLIRVKDTKFPKEELYDRYYKLVFKIVNKFNRGYRHDQEELISEGLLGLVKAYNNYDWERDGTSFYTFTTHCVTNQILMYLRSKRSLKFQMNSFSLSLDHTYEGKDKSDMSLMDIISTTDFDDTTTIVAEFIAILPPREQYVVGELLLGKTHREIAAVLGCTPSRVSRLVKNIGLNYLAGNMTMKSLVR